MKWIEGQWDDEPWPDCDPIYPGGWEGYELRLMLLTQRTGEQTAITQNLEPIAPYIRLHPRFEKPVPRPVKNMDLRPIIMHSTGVNHEEML